MYKWIKLSLVYLLFCSISFASTIAENKENHFEKHIEFWLIIIAIAIGYIIFRYKKR
jgi:hypothetical protein